MRTYSPTQPTAAQLPFGKALDPSVLCVRQQRTGRLPVWINGMRWKYWCDFPAFRWFNAFKDVQLYKRLTLHLEVWIKRWFLYLCSLRLLLYVQKETNALSLTSRILLQHRPSKQQFDTKPLNSFSQSLYPHPTVFISTYCSLFFYFFMFKSPRKSLFHPRVLLEQALFDSIVGVLLCYNITDWGDLCTVYCDM